MKRRDFFLIAPNNFDGLHLHYEQVPPMMILIKPA